MPAALAAKREESVKTHPTPFGEESPKTHPSPFVSSEVETRCATCLDFARHERI